MLMIIIEITEKEPIKIVIQIKKIINEKEVNQDKNIYNNIELKGEKMEEDQPIKLNMNLIPSNNIIKVNFSGNNVFKKDINYKL